MRAVSIAIALLVGILLGGDAGSAPLIDRDARLAAIREEIGRLETELARLDRREEGLLGEIERLGAEVRLRGAELREVQVRLEGVNQALADRHSEVDRLVSSQEDRRRYLAFRLREMYKEGPQRSLRRLVAGEAIESYLTGLRYAAYLSERDGRILQEYRETSVRLAEQTAALAQEQQQLETMQSELDRSRRRLRTTRDRRSRLLEQIRTDQAARRGALAELQSAAIDLQNLVGSFVPADRQPEMDVRKFRGLLDWPSEGKVREGFGSVVHPRFKTRVPHPGLDIEAEFGDDIRSVFDGTVVFAAWMRGYGLTTIVDHGRGLLSIYAHASVLLVEKGEAVGRGQLLGKVGDTGSLKGPFLYVELRVDGQPADPIDWFRPR